MPILGLRCDEAKTCKAPWPPTSPPVRLQPDNALWHAEAGQELIQLGRFSEAAAALAQAVRYGPEVADYHNGLGVALSMTQDYEGAAAAYQQVIRLRPKYAGGHANWATLQRRLGKFDAALHALAKAQQLAAGDAQAAARYGAEVRRCQRLIALEPRLSGVLAGKDPATADEWIEFADLCQHKQWPGATVRCYEQAFVAQPGLVGRHRYQAACAAVMAGDGQGKDPEMTAPERARCRRQALDWLRAELSLYSKRLATAKPAEAQALEATLAHWEGSAELAAARNARALARLPAAERTAWRQFWIEVQELRRKPKANDGPPVRTVSRLM